MAPLAEAVGLPVTIDGRVIEGGNLFEGQLVTPLSLLKGGPKSWWLFRNMLKPTWGEAYKVIVERMRLAMADAVQAANGHEAVIVSHQLPIWMSRCAAEGRRLAHDPRKRECTLASITTFSYIDGRVSSVSYREPAADLLRQRQTKKFVAGA
jgi:broad specificity phosphatase PhoE